MSLRSISTTRKKKKKKAAQGGTVGVLVGSPSPRRQCRSHRSEARPCASFWTRDVTRSVHASLLETLQVSPCVSLGLASPTLLARTLCLLPAPQHWGSPSVWSHNMLHQRETHWPTAWIWGSFYLRKASPAHPATLSNPPCTPKETSRGPCTAAVSVGVGKSATSYTWETGEQLQFNQVPEYHTAVSTRT